MHTYCILHWNLASNQDQVQCINIHQNKAKKLSPAPACPSAKGGDKGGYVTNPRTAGPQELLPSFCAWRRGNSRVSLISRRRATSPQLISTNQIHLDPDITQRRCLLFFDGNSMSLVFSFLMIVGSATSLGQHSPYLTRRPDSKEPLWLSFVWLILLLT